MIAIRRVLVPTLCVGTSVLPVFLPIRRKWNALRIVWTARRQRKRRSMPNWSPSTYDLKVGLIQERLPRRKQGAGSSGTEGALICWFRRGRNEGVRVIEESCDESHD
jgi:hypothetical protein